MIYPLYTAAFALLTAGYLPTALYRRLARGVPLNLRARLGFDGPPPTGGPSAWVHAGSVGETIAAEPLVDGLRRVYPEPPVGKTTGTEAGRRGRPDGWAGLRPDPFG